MRVAVILLVGILGGCAGGGADSGLNTASAPAMSKRTPYKLTAAEMAMIEDGVRSSLKDPASAVFRDVVAAVDEKGRVTACGMVNAKNSYGAYGGFKPFMGAIAGTPAKRAFLTASMGGASTETAVTLEMCRRDGMTLTI